MAEDITHYPRRFRFPTTGGRHPTGRVVPYRYGCYFPMTDLCVGDMGGPGTGVPKDVEWIDPHPSVRSLTTVEDERG